MSVSVSRLSGPPLPWPRCTRRDNLGEWGWPGWRLGPKGQGHGQGLAGRCRPRGRQGSSSQVATPPFDCLIAAACLGSAPSPPQPSPPAAAESRGGVGPTVLECPSRTPAVQTGPGQLRPSTGTGSKWQASVVEPPSGPAPLRTNLGGWRGWRCPSQTAAPPAIPRTTSPPRPAQPAHLVLEGRPAARWPTAARPVWKTAPSPTPAHPGPPLALGCLGRLAIRLTQTSRR